MYNLCVLLIVFLTAGLLETGQALKITKLSVPDVAQAHITRTLDCEYSLDDDDQDLVVKWYFGNDNSLVYQWIPNHEPVALGILKGRVNLYYDGKSQQQGHHRAVQISDPSPELSGNYTCQVSTLKSEASETKQMIVYALPTHFEIFQRPEADGDSEVSCTAYGVSPVPKMTLSIGNRAVISSPLQIKESNNVFDVLLTGRLDVNSQNERVTCRLEIPHSNYVDVRTTALRDYASLSEGTTLQHSLMSLCLVTLSLIFFAC